MSTEATIRPVRPDEVDELFAMICELAEFERSKHEVASTAADFQLALFGPDPKVYALVVDEGDQLAGFAISERFYEIGSHAGLEELDRLLRKAP